MFFFVNYAKAESQIANLLPHSILTVILNVLTALMNLKGYTLTAIYNVSKLSDAARRAGLTDGRMRYSSPPPAL